MPIPARPRVRDDDQLSLELSWLDERGFRDAMRIRGVELSRVRFKHNRSRLISLSADRGTLNVHACFQAAPCAVLDAVAAFARASQSSVEYRRAISRMRSWWASQAREARVEAGTAPVRVVCCATPAQRQYLARLYRHLNGERFGGRLPELLPVRLSPRMSRRFGHIHYAHGAGGERVVAEIALNVDLLLPGNEGALVDTLVHEMAHAEAYLAHGHRGHGRLWRCIARRVGCEPRALTHARMRRRRRGDAPTERVPEAGLAAVREAEAPPVYRSS
jgi:hypothetical protein